MRDHVERLGLSPRTHVHYQYLLDNFILPAIGKTYLRDIKPVTLNNLYSRIEKQPSRGRKGHISGTYLQKVHGLLKNMLSDAVRWGMIAVNPADRVAAPRKETPNHTAYETYQCIALLDVLDKEPLKWRALGVFALYSQMRRGEIVALNWTDINGDTVSVQRSAIYIPGKGVSLHKTKTNASVRQLVISQDVLKLLREWKIQQAKDRLALGGAWIDEGAVFTQWNGGRMHVESPTKWFKQFLERNDLPHIRFHDLRHTGASLLIAKGMDVESVRQRLGHADANTTLRFYAHAFSDAEKRSADILQEAFKRSK
jgi:integrase